MGGPVRLELTGDEALVLFDFLVRCENDDALAPAIRDQAEQRALWTLHGHLERRLVEVIHPDYLALVAAARDRLRDPAE